MRDLSLKRVHSEYNLPSFVVFCSYVCCYFIVYVFHKPKLPLVVQKGVVSTETIQPHKMVEMGHEYKDVSKYQQRGGEYAVIGKYAVVGT